MDTKRHIEWDQYDFEISKLEEGASEKASCYKLRK
jgi:hypothetical protein